ncbi:hypothetical protein Btru_022474 [Bulinus truncatus]|nr:hypothetical protein Btru_022474 [Bulinus truncatus]
MLHAWLLLCVTAVSIKEMSGADNSVQNGVTVSPPAANWFCSEGWTEFNDGQDVTCLWLSNSPVNHAKAESQCRTHGATLVKINTERKIRAFKEKFPKFDNEYWTGLKKERGYDESFMWDDLSRNVNSQVLSLKHLLTLTFIIAYFVCLIKTTV